MDPSDGRPGPLLEQEDLYRVLFEQAADPMYLIDPATGRFLDANDIAFRVTGWSREELLGMTFRELHDPGDAALLDSIEPRLREQGRIRLAGVSQRRRDGTLLPVELSLSRLEAGDRVYGFVVAHDITQRLREAEQLQSQAAALAEAKGFLEA
ncbi:MAG TPA: PAS domain S-box protein, partial [Thermoanaerobaculia bacterium]